MTIAMLLHNTLKAARMSIHGSEPEAAYREMAEDKARETEALEWAEGTIGNVADETR